ncbi:PhoX family phosphatase [Gordonia sp. zg691]|uniref:PhoX family protein n=1 Tax=Gordonia jinghuaiqii TaxID=2758710 RepID=UPI00166221CB|nr:PhoX family phosphatase [Gordonia jinghuaiqii]MBD0862769.1 PhoX family phosphatase [Gordonia jinghuaiqii]
MRIPLQLFMSTGEDAGRSRRAHVTCRYKCGDACRQDPGNTSDNTYFRDVVRTAVSRRSVLKTSAGAAVAVGATSLLAACGDAGSSGSGSSGGAASPGDALPGMKFTAVAPNTEDAVVIPEGYAQEVVIRWGDPVLPGAPEFDFAKQTPEAQAGQFGFNNDFAGLIPVDGVPNHFYLVANLEYPTEPFMFAGYQDGEPTEQQARIAMASVGIAVVEVVAQSGSGALTPVVGPRNQRLTASSPFRLTGPAAGSEFVTTTADPAGTTVLGTFANCSGGLTPWGTMLSGEENFNTYFGNASTVTDPETVERLDRYSFDDDGDEHHWGRFEDRFDLAKEPNEANRFGYIVEVDPHDPEAVAVKHSSLGRFKHESANIYVVGGAPGTDRGPGTDRDPDNGTVVAYSGDDEKFEYIYKFVSSRKIKSGLSKTAREHNMGILDEGTLYVATFTGDSAEPVDGAGDHPSAGKFAGRGSWKPLLTVDADGSARSYIPGMSAAEVAVFTRQAADAVGATKMDRPEDIEPNPKTGKVYCALTNNSDRGTGGEAVADAANPRNENKNGQILEITDNHAGTEFTWELLLVCGDPAAADTYYGGFDKTAVSPISCPDNVAFDPHGNLWISTDGNALGTNDGLFAVALDGKRRGETKQFLTVPRGGETCGPVIDSDRILIAVQHPGELDDHSADNPASHWPDGGNSQPRPSVVAVWRNGGEPIGV